MANTKEKWQEIANRGLQDKFDPATRAKFDEAVNRGLITMQQPAQQAPQPMQQPMQQPAEQPTQQAPVAQDNDWMPTDENLALERDRVDNLPERGFVDVATGIGEAALTTATGATTGALGYLAGSAQDIATQLTGGEDKKRRESYAQSLTYAPKGKAGQEYVSDIGEAVSALPPVLGTTPLTGVKQSLTSTLNSVIPNKVLSAGALKSKAGRKAILKQEIAEGNPNIETVAKALNSKGDIIDIKESKNVISKIGNTDRNRETVSVLERLDPASKKQVNKMLDNIEHKMKFPDSDARPSHIVGESVANRAKAIAVKNEQASKRIGSVAKSLEGSKVNIQQPVNTFTDSLRDMGVTITKGDDGWFTPDFSRSKFVGGNQKDMSVLINELLNGDINFKQAHELKKIIRDNVDFDKGGAGQIKGDSQRLLKNLASDIDGVLDNTSTPYKKANERFAKTVALKEQYQKMAGKDIDLFDDLSSEALALKARRMSSNAASGVDFKNTIANTDKVLKELGVEFKDNIHSLNFVVNRLDDLFKVTPETSLQGVVSRGVNTALSPTAAIADAALGKVKDKLSVSDVKKIKAIRALMNKK